MATDPDRDRHDGRGSDDDRRAAVIAGHTGDRTTAEALVGSADPGTRAAALGALRRMEALGDDHLVDALADPAASVRMRACELVAADRDDASDPVAPELITAVGRLLEDPDPMVVEVACWALGEIPPVPASLRARLASIATDHDDSLCRESAVAALGSLGEPDGLEAILRATEDRATVRRRAIIALAPFEGPEVDAAIERARSDRDWQVRQAAEDLSP